MVGADLHLLVYAFVCSAYGLAAAQTVWRLRRAPCRVAMPRLERCSAWLAFAGHVGLVAVAMHDPLGLRFGFAPALSLLMAVAVGLFLLEEWFVRLDLLRPPLLVLAALAALGPWFYGGSLIHSPGWPLKAHLWLAMVAYAVIGVAASHALLMLALEKGLQRRAGRSGLLQHAPALLPLEQLLFKLLRLGFGLLTAALLMGAGVGRGWFDWVGGGAVLGLRFDHKTIFSLLAWLTLALLLAGRYRFGWRGKTAIHWTLAGFAMLSMAYVGSRFVLEAVLHRLGN